jgi:FkbM family methyltransferase
MISKPDSVVAKWLVAAGAWQSPFSLVDVGASGGIAGLWAVFGDALHALGFDPYVNEVNRLNADEHRPHVKYEAAFVGARDFDAVFPADLRNDRVRSRNNDPFGRVSASRVMELLHRDYASDAYNRGAAPVMATRTVTLDEAVPAPTAVDFIKIDTDGHDIEVLLGAERLIRTSALGVMIECQFHGAAHPHANTLANIDVFLRERGFSLFDLDVNRYSRSALPAPFVYDIPAQTVSGQALWGDALYLRDLGDLTYERKYPFAVTADRVLKLATLFALFRLPDCVAELLLNRSDLVPRSLQAELLDLLPAEMGAGSVSYRDYVAAFERDPASLYPRSRR